MTYRKLYLRISVALVALASVSLAGVSAYDRDALKAVPVVGRLPWQLMIGNTALQAENREVDYFAPEAAKAVETQPELLFLGDSLSRYWRKDGKRAWGEHFAPLDANSLGVSGDRTQHLLHRLRSGAIDNLQPQAIVLQIGTNNVNRNTPEEISEAIETIVAEIKQRWPAARLVVVAIPPREMPRSRDVLARVHETNQILAAALADQPDVTFINVNDRLLDADGWINPAMFTKEGVHLSEKAYALLADEIHSALLTSAL